jgi:precorrin-6Y C5,15-methyltransferase (decarboxylating)
VRVQILAELALQPNQTVWDIGAGTGSVSIEMAQLCPNSRIYAIEQTPAGISLIERNIRSLASIKTLTLNPSPDLGEGLENQQRNRRNSRFLAPLRPPWEKGLGDEGC